MSRLLKLPLVAALVCASPAFAAAAQNPGQLPARMLTAHNAARAQAGVQPLAWDPALGAAAASYAMQLAMTNSFQHSDRRARPGIGENLWMGTRGAFSYDAMVGRWVAERSDFVPGIFPAVSRSGNWARVGHYTQMVWPTTTRVGCAVASNANSDFLVCRYSPKGNVDGHPLLYAASASAPPRAR